MADLGGGNPAGTPAPIGGASNDAARGAPMPEIPADTVRARPSDFAKMRARGDLPTQAPKPQTASQRIGEIARQLENPDSKPTEPKLDANGQPKGPDTEPAVTEEPREQREEQTPALSAADDQAALAKYREWESSDLFLPEMAQGKLVKVEADGQTRYVSHEELVNNYQRRAPIMRREQEIRAREEQVAQRDNAWKEHWEALKNPEHMHEILERRGYGEQLEAMADRINVQRQKDNSFLKAAGRAAAEAAGYSYQEILSGAADNDRRVRDAMVAARDEIKGRRAIEVENRRLRHETETARQAIESQRSEKAQEHWKGVYNNQLNQLRPGAMQQQRIEPTEANKAKFMRHLQEVVQLAGGIGKDGITREFCMEAARAMREELEDQRAREGNSYMSPEEWKAHQQAQARQTGQPLGPGRAGTGGGRPLVQTQGQSLRASDFAKRRGQGKLGQY